MKRSSRRGEEVKSEKPNGNGIMIVLLRVIPVCLDGAVSLMASAKTKLKALFNCSHCNQCAQFSAVHAKLIIIAIFFSTIFYNVPLHYTISMCMW